MDEAHFEMAQRLQEAQLQNALDSRVQYQGESAEDCESCGIDIPQERRLAVPGCQCCFDCQTLREGRR
ncbi:TraR/DksA C4-type zinc finger protein [Pseudomonas sp. ML96]|uniref:TraR/DksA C4-type zinc finger protein n=1 Tax=Pseudomonas sp. ML96 TaxID=1523503 RepID=UPI0005BBD6F8|nr:TraR/DksA C4-type zinc finger protein [Pseudomonas sp. ML96]